MNVFEREYQLIGLKYSQMSQVELLETIEAKYATLSPYMDERTRRIWAAVEARSMGWGGVSRVAEATGISRATIAAGLQELESLNQTTEEVLPPSADSRSGWWTQANRGDK